MEIPQSHQCSKLRVQTESLQGPVQVWVNARLPNHLSTGREVLNPDLMMEFQWQRGRDKSR